MVEGTPETEQSVAREARAAARPGIRAATAWPDEVAGDGDASVTPAMVTELGSARRGVHVSREPVIGQCRTVWDFGDR